MAKCTYYVVTDNRRLGESMNTPVNIISDGICYSGKIDIISLNKIIKHLETIRNPRRIQVISIDINELYLTLMTSDAPTDETLAYRYEVLIHEYILVKQSSGNINDFISSVVSRPLTSKNGIIVDYSKGYQLALNKFYLYHDDLLASVEYAEDDLIVYAGFTSSHIANIIIA